MNKKVSSHSSTYKNPILTLLKAGILLFACSFMIVFIFGRTCTLRFNVQDFKEYTVSYDEKIVECIERQEKNGNVELTFKMISPGKTIVRIEDPASDESRKESIYAHPSGIITVNSYLGHCNGDSSFILSIWFLMILAMYLLIKRYRNSMKRTLYSYANIGLLGMIIYDGFLLGMTTILTAYFFFHVSAYGYYLSVGDLLTIMMQSTALFTLVLLPFLFVVFIFVSLSNLILLKREGFTWRNMLGVILGIGLCFLSLLPFFIRIPSFVSYPGTELSAYMTEYIHALIRMFTVYLECLLFGSVISGFIAARHIPKFDKDYLLILGCMIQKDGSLTKLLQSRVDRALEFARMQKEKTGKELVFVPSGGQGGDEVISEAEAMERYILKQGISKDRILKEDQSKNTFENIRNSYELIRERTEHANIAFSTTNYHVFRAGCIADEMDIPIEGIGAPTRSYFWINAYIREFIAALNTEKRNHIRVLVILSIGILIGEVLFYLS